MPDGLYDRDALAWSEQQADLLRRLARGERVNDAIDWENVIEEVEELGLSQLRACTNLLRQATLHLLKLHAWPASTGVSGWRREVRAFLDAAEEQYAPSMRQRIDLGMLYSRAVRALREDTDGSGAALPVPESCPFALERLLADDVDALLQAVTAAMEDR